MRVWNGEQLILSGGRVKAFRFASWPRVRPEFAPKRPVGFLSAMLVLGCPAGFGLLEFFLPATLLLGCPAGFGLLEFFLPATLLLGCPAGFGLLEFFLPATLLLGCPSGFGLLEFFLSATLLLGCPAGFGLLEFFLSATLLLGCPAGFGLLEFFLSAMLLLGCPVGLRPAGVLPVGDAPPRLPAQASACWSSSCRRRSSWLSLSDRSLLFVSSVGCSSSSMTSNLPLERRPGGGSSIMRSMGSESAVTSSLASFKTASWTRQVTAATSASSSISSRTRCQCKRSSRSLPIAAMYSHASPTVRSVPPSFVGRGEVSFLERYAGRNMARKLKAGGDVFSRTLTWMQNIELAQISQDIVERFYNGRGVLAARSRQ